MKPNNDNDKNVTTSQPSEQSENNGLLEYANTKSNSNHSISISISISIIISNDTYCKHDTPHESTDSCTCRCEYKYYNIDND